MYSRKCPKCGKEINYKHEISRNRAEIKQTICFSCNAKTNGWAKFNKEVTDNTRKSVWQGKHHSQESKNKIRDKHIEVSYLYKTDKFRKTMSDVTSGKKNPMYKKNIMSVWIEKYGAEEAEKRKKSWKKSISIGTSGEKNPMYGKPIPKGCGKGISGWYKNFYFRSLHELKFLLISERFKLNITSIEKLKIPYVNYDGTNRTYSPDYLVNNEVILEIKPKKLMNTPGNILKFNAAKIYCEKNDLKFKVKDFGIINHDELQKLINDKIVKLNKPLNVKK